MKAEHQQLYVVSASTVSNHLKNNIFWSSKCIMLPAAHGFALVTPASRGLGFAFTHRLLTRTELPVIATARKNCDELQERLLSSKGIPKDAEQRLRILQVDVTGKKSNSIPGDTSFSAM